MTDDAKCPHCHRPAYVRHGGMGGGIMPDNETHCLRQQGRDCRIATEGYRAAEKELQVARAKLALVQRIALESDCDESCVTQGGHHPWCLRCSISEELR